MYMQTIVEWISPLEGTEFEPEVVHLGTCPPAVEPAAQAWGQVLALTDDAIVRLSGAITLLVVRYDHRFGLLGTLYRERDRQVLLDALRQMQSRSSWAWDARWAGFYDEVEIASTQAGFPSVTELVRYLKRCGQQTASAAAA